MLRLEEALWASGLQRVAGMDEVGVGPLAGPIVAAAVVLPPGCRIEGVRDSKALSRRRREVLDGEIRSRAVAIGFGIVEAAEVDRINPLQGGLCAMRRALDALPEVPEHLLIDARTLPDIDVPQTALIRGDARVHSIGAASIVAKVFRDRLMARLDLDYPGYGFGRHAGYGTVVHLDALQRLGPSPVHRLSYGPVRRAAERQAAAAMGLSARGRHNGDDEENSAEPALIPEGD